MTKIIRRKCSILRSFLISFGLSEDDFHHVIHLCALGFRNREVEIAVVHHPLDGVQIAQQRHLSWQAVYLDGHLLR
jgi:hypothetical protein